MSEAAGQDTPKESAYGPVRVLFGDRDGRYPDGNSILVEGERETVIIDPARGLVARAGILPRIDRVINSHCHEDHIAGNHLFPDVPWHLHEADAPGIASLDGMMAIYGLEGAAERAFRKLVVDEFHYTSRDDATHYRDGDCFDLGGVRLEIIHTPGHTRGHCCIMIRWGAGKRRGRRGGGGSARDSEQSLLYLADIELTRFGPYYGDAWSSLEDFERSLALVRDIEADRYATFHHIGVLEGRAAYLERLDLFESMIATREARLLEYLGEPHDLDEIVRHRFVYRPGEPDGFIDGVERRSMGQHIARLLARGELQELDGGRFLAAAARGA